MIDQAQQTDVMLGWMGCLADSTRLRLLRLLERNELGVAELCDVVQLPQSTVSRHLKVLADQGWVQSRRLGTNHLYQLTMDELEPAARKLWLLAREQTEGWATGKHDLLRLQRLLSQRQADSQAFFASAAEQWDKMRDELYGSSFTLTALLSLLWPEMVVADLGCGTGRAAALLAPAVKQVIGVDISAAMLKAARRRTADAGNVELRRGQVTALPIDDQACDAAMMLLTLTYVAEPGNALREAKRILRPGGRIVIVDLLRHDRDDFRRQMDQLTNGFETASIERELLDCGFDAVAARALAPESKATGPGLFLATARKPLQ